VFCVLAFVRDRVSVLELMLPDVRVDAVTDELVVSVETERLLAPSVETLMLLTDIALVHVSALLTPLVRTMFVGTGVNKLMVILLHKNLREEVLHRDTDLHGDSEIHTNFIGIC
jgi:hypothetical protein